MNYKKIITNSVIIFAICSIFHFGYDIFPNFLTSLFFPVNESVWEHLKMIFTSTIVFNFISNLFYKEENVFFRGYIKSMATIIILLLLYIPFRHFFGEVMIITLLILFISIFLSEVIASKISEKKRYKTMDIVSIFLLIINFIIFCYFTYYPQKAGLFYDTEHHKYGIDILNE